MVSVGHTHTLTQPGPQIPPFLLADPLFNLGLAHSELQGKLRPREAMSPTPNPSVKPESGSVEPWFGAVVLFPVGLALRHVTRGMAPNLSEPLLCAGFPRDWESFKELGEEAC